MLEEDINNSFKSVNETTTKKLKKMTAVKITNNQIVNDRSAESNERRKEREREIERETDIKILLYNENT